MLNSNDYRGEIIDAIVPYARDDPRIVLLVCDMGFGVTNRFKDEFPDRIFNTGIMEQGTEVLSGKIKEDLGNGEYVIELKIKFKPDDDNDVLISNDGIIRRRPMMMLASNSDEVHSTTHVWYEPVLGWEIETMKTE